MKCWMCNKNNPVNKGKSVNFNDYGDYGDLSCVIGMLSAIFAAKQSNRKKAMQQEQDANNESSKEVENYAKKEKM